MTRKYSRAHIAQGDDGTFTAMWGSHVLHSAFQPIFAFQNGRLTLAAFEALIRPVHGQQPVSPSYFFRSVLPQDRFAVDSLTRTLHLLNAGRCLDKSATIFLNIDPSLFSDSEVAQRALRDMLRIMAVADIEPSRIVCEMTEQISVSEPTLFTFVESLRKHGFRIAVDDYGAEHSDIRRVEQLKPDIVKFDADWINQLMTSCGGMALLNMMVATFSQQGINTVIEGVEEGWQLDLAESAGASMVQGYLLARPQLAPADFAVFKRTERFSRVNLDPTFTPPATGADPEVWISSGPVPELPLAGAQTGRARTFGRRQVMP